MREQEAAKTRAERAAHNAAKAERQAAYQQQKAEKRAARERRDRAFKRNRDLRGLAHAKLVAVCYRKKQNGVWVHSDKSYEGARQWLIGRQKEATADTDF